MPVPSASRLLRELDPLAAPDRSRYVALVGQRCAGDPHLPALLDDLAGRGRFERGLAVAIAAAARDVAFLTRALADPDPGVRVAAVSTARYLPLPDPQLRRLLIDAPAALRRPVYRAVKASGRHALADELLDDVWLRYGDGEAASLLPACTAELVAARLPTLAHAVRNWTALGRRHPGAVLDVLEREFARLPPPLRERRWAQCAGGLAAAAERQPTRVLALINDHGPWGPLPAALASRLGLLLAADPAGVATLLAVPGRRVVRFGRTLRRAARGLSAAQLDRLAAAVRDRPEELAALLAAVPLDRREATYDRTMAGTDQTSALLPEALLRALPRHRAVAEARRVMTLRSVQADPALLLRLRAHLPLTEAVEHLDRATRRASARDRAAACRLLVECAARTGDPGAFHATLAGLTRVNHDRDPVRRAVLLAVGAAPLGLFTEDLLPVLDQLVAGAVGAPDCSRRTRDAVIALVARLISADPARYRMVRPWVAAEARRSRYDLAVALATALGPRASAELVELQEALGRATTAADDHTARVAVALWLAPPGTRDARVELLIRQDPSTALLPAVLTTLATRRTDLLESTLLGPPAPAGRFAGPDAHPVQLVGREVHRWLPRQVATYAALLTAVAADHSLPVSHRTAALRALGALPGLGARAVRPFLPTVAVAAAALDALSRGDRPDLSLPAVLPWVTPSNPAPINADLARVAVRAAARCARFVPPSRLPALLDPMSTASQVAVRAEAARLRAALRAPGAVGALVAAWHREGEHREVRAAALAGLGGLLDDERAWGVLDGAAAGPPDQALPLLAAQPPALAARHRDRYAELVRRLCSAADPEVRGAALTAAPDWLAWSAELAPELGRRMADLTDEVTWTSAAAALIAAVEAGLGRQPLVAALRGLLLAESRPATPDAGPDRDRPARQRVTALVAGLTSRSPRPELVDAALAGAADALAADRSFLPLAVRLAVQRVPALPPHSPLGQLDRVADVLAEWPVTAALAADVLATRLAATTAWWDPGAVRDDIARLGGRGDLAGGLLATAAAAVAGPRQGWPEPWRAALRGLRHHPEPEVRHAALALVTATGTAATRSPSPGAGPPGWPGWPGLWPGPEPR